MTRPRSRAAIHSIREDQRKKLDLATDQFLDVMRRARTISEKAHIADLFAASLRVIKGAAE